MSNPDILNLDEVELPESPLAISHKGVKHPMRTLTVGDFINQARRQKQVDDAGETSEGGEGNTPATIVDVIETVRDQIRELFPTLPVDELEQPKLWAIFNWLRETREKITEEAAPEQASAEGNETTPEATPAT
jgi:hypothetical protein